MVCWFRLLGFIVFFCFDFVVCFLGLWVSVFCVFFVFFFLWGEVWGWGFLFLVWCDRGGLFLVCLWLCCVV